MGAGDKTGKRVSTFLIRYLYTKVQKSPGQPSWLFLGWFRKSPKLNVTHYNKNIKNEIQELNDKFEENIKKINIRIDNLENSSNINNFNNSNKKIIIKNWK